MLRNIFGRPSVAAPPYDTERAPLAPCTKEDLRKAQDESTRWRKRADEEREALRTCEQALTNAQRRYECLREQSRDVERETVALRERVKTLEEEMRERSERSRVVQDDLRVTKQLLLSQQQQYVALEVTHTKSVRLLETRSSELQDAQKYLTKTDRLSGADILRFVEHLNAQISQAAAHIADSAQFELPATRALPSDISIPTQLLGPTMVELLHKVPHRDDPICVQLALQACMVAFLRHIATMWAAKPDYDDRLITEIYAGVKKHGQSPFA